MPVVEPAAVSGIPSLIAAAMAPVFMLAGLGAILNVISMRLVRAIDRWRAVDEFIHESEDAPAIASEELEFTQRRIVLSTAATFLCVASCLCICVVVVLLFINPAFQIDFGRMAALWFIAAMVLLAGGLLAFLAEVFNAIRAPRTRLKK